MKIKLIKLIKRCQLQLNKSKLDESSTQILEATKSNDSNAEDINFVRLRKMYNSLLKEKNKIEENHGNIVSDYQNLMTKLMTGL